MITILCCSAIGGLIGYLYDCYKARNDTKYIQEVVSHIEKNGFVAYPARK